MNRRVMCGRLVAVLGLLLATVPRPAYAQQPDSALIAYARQFVRAVTVARNENLANVSDRLRKVTAPEAYGALQELVASRAREAGRLQEEAARLPVNQRDQIVLTPLTTRALEAAQQYPLAYDQYIAARDALLAELQKAGIQFRKE